MTEYPGLNFSQDAGRLLAALQPPADHPILDLAMLRAALADAGYANCVLHEAALATLIERYNAATAEAELPIGVCQDASFSLEVAADSMHAWVDLIPAAGGKTIDPADLILALAAAGIVFGVDETAISTITVANARTAVARVLVASGVPAQDGENARFELLVADARDRTPQLDEKGFIDFRELGAIPMVDVDQPLMRRVSPTTGTAGRNVRGALIEPLRGRDEVFQAHLVGAYVASDDSNLLRAVFAGQPVRCGNGVTVEQVLNVRNVNMASGNISFKGTVHVSGEVLPGMKVRASGDIVVGDVVDGAELEAEGDIRVVGGIIAKARVSAGGSVTARFVENAHIAAGTTIAIDDSAIQSDLQANNQIIIGAKAPQRGRLAGGSARTTMLIKTPLLGSPTSGLTSLSLGVNPVLEASYQSLLAHIAKLREDEDKLEKVVKHLAMHGDKGGLLERAKASWQQAIQAWAVLLPERDELENQLTLIGGARVEVTVGVVGAVDISFGKKVQRLRQTYERGAFSRDGENVVFTGPGGKASVAT